MDKNFIKQVEKSGGKTTTYYGSIKRVVELLNNGKFRISVYKLNCSTISDRAVLVKPTLMHRNISM